MNADQTADTDIAEFLDSQGNTFTGISSACASQKRRAVLLTHQGV
jgi:hypothetical protein